MKLFIACALISLAMCLPHIFDEAKIKGDIQFLLQKFASSDLTRQACQTECEKYVTGNQEVNKVFMCPLACMGIQKELEKVVSPHHSKRSFLFSHIPHLDFHSILDLEHFKADLQMLVDILGTDPLEQKCEDECHALAADGSFTHFFCQPTCKTFQLLVNQLHIVPDPTSPVPPATV